MKLKTVRAGDWRILAVCTERDDCPLLEFLAGLEGRLARDGRRMLRLLDRISDQGPPRNTEISHQLSSRIWQLIQGQLRVLWFYDEGKLMICSHGFLKKRRRTPRGEIERAQETQRLYAEAKASGDVEIDEESL